MFLNSQINKGDTSGFKLPEDGGGNKIITQERNYEYGAANRQRYSRLHVFPI